MLTGYTCVCITLSVFRHEKSLFLLSREQQKHIVTYCKKWFSSGHVTSVPPEDLEQVIAQKIDEKFSSLEDIERLFADASRGDDDTSRGFLALYHVYSMLDVASRRDDVPTKLSVKELLGSQPGRRSRRRSPRSSRPISGRWGVVQQRLLPRLRTSALAQSRQLGVHETWLQNFLISRGVQAGLYEFRSASDDETILCCLVPHSEGDGTRGWVPHAGSDRQFVLS